MNTIMKQELKLKCFVCGENLATTQQDECPECKNVLGISVHTLKVVSIREILLKKQLSEDVLAFAFDFDFDTQLDCFKNMQFNNIVKPFLGVEVTVNVSGMTGFGGVRAVAVFYGEHEIEVQLTNEQVKYIADKVMPFVAACAQGVNIDELELDLSIDNLEYELNARKSDAKIDINPTFDEDSECKDGVLHPIDIANAMFSITSDDFIVSQDAWNSFPSKFKARIGEALQQDPRALVDLINYTQYNYKNDNFDELRSLVEAIIEHYFKSFSINEALDKISKICDEIEEDSLELRLANVLDVNDVEYNLYDAFEISDFTNEHTMFSLVNDDDEECLHIAVLDDEYRIFENVRELKSNKFFDLNDKNSTSLEIDELLTLISKMGLIKAEFKCVTKEDIEEILEFGNLDDLDFNVSEDIKDDELDDTIVTNESTINLGRLQLLKQLQELSDEDLMNELKRRMSSR